MITIDPSNLNLELRSPVLHFTNSSLCSKSNKSRCCATDLG
ncbi:hypothetical protein HanIR_Chr14g0699241 [Helianthus annuus]|nr:hypothetical protein HanIR_Chr14g0699241 [Helianthus annuus]